MHNREDVYIGDIFHLGFHGVNVFLQVIDTDWEKVYVRELATRTYEHNTRETVLERPRKDGKCLVIPDGIHNGGKGFGLKPFALDNGYAYLEVPVENDSELVKAAIRINGPESENSVRPKFGKAYAIRISDDSNWRNWYFECKSGFKRKTAENREKDIIWK